MHDKAAAFLLTLKLILDSFVKDKMLEKLDSVIFSDDIDLDDIDFEIATFFSHGAGQNTIDLNNINFYYDNFDKDNPAVVLIRLIAWSISFKQQKACKKI